MTSPPAVPRVSGAECYPGGDMVAVGRRRHRYTYAQYVALERDSPTKHEFFDGEIYAMTGAPRNPLLLLEVTSDSSEEYDTGSKLEAYQTIPTLREVVLVSHRERRITIHRRDPAGAWTMRVAIAGGRVTVESLGAELTVDAVYRNSAIT